MKRNPGFLHWCLAFWGTLTLLTLLIKFLMVPDFTLDPASAYAFKALIVSLASVPMKMLGEWLISKAREARQSRNQPQGKDDDEKSDPPPEAP